MGESIRHLSCGTVTATMTVLAYVFCISAIKGCTGCGLVKSAITWEWVRNANDLPQTCQIRICGAGTQQFV